MRAYFCIEFTFFMLNNKSLTDSTNQFSPHDFKENSKMVF